MGLDMSKVSSAIKKYGEKLYEQTQSFGTVGPGEYTLIIDENGRRSLDLHNGYFAKVQEVAIIDENSVFEIVEMIAMRDASGVLNGQPWTVTKGKGYLLARS